MNINTHDEMAPYVTLDGSETRELAHPANSPVRLQSLAEATLAPGGATRKHLHARSEEIYYILQGAAQMHLEDEEQSVKAGDVVVIPPGRKHKITNTGADALVFLCCCAPPYSHDDTFFTE